MGTKSTLHFLYNYDVNLIYESHSFVSVPFGAIIVIQISAFVFCKFSKFSHFGGGELLHYVARQPTQVACVFVDRRIQRCVPRFRGRDTNSGEKTEVITRTNLKQRRCYRVRIPSKSDSIGGAAPIPNPMRHHHFP